MNTQFASLLKNMELILWLPVNPHLKFGVSPMITKNENNFYICPFCCSVVIKLMQISEEAYNSLFWEDYDL
jgi:hypothetical protein